jgi:glutamine amidotransferase
LFVRTDADGVVLASEPFDDDEDWQEIPDRHLVTVTDSRVELAALKGSA